MPRPVIFPQNPDILTSDQNLNVALVYNGSGFGAGGGSFRHPASTHALYIFNQRGPRPNPGTLQTLATSPGQSSAAR